MAQKLILLFIIYMAVQLSLCLNSEQSYAYSKKRTLSEALLEPYFQSVTPNDDNYLDTPDQWSRYSVNYPFTNKRALLTLRTEIPIDLQFKPNSSTQDIQVTTRTDDSLVYSSTPQREIFLSQENSLTLDLTNSSFEKIAVSLPSDITTRIMGWDGRRSKALHRPIDLHQKSIENFGGQSWIFADGVKINSFWNEFLAVVSENPLIIILGKTGRVKWHRAQDRGPFQTHYIKLSSTSGRVVGNGSWVAIEINESDDSSITELEIPRFASLEVKLTNGDVFYEKSELNAASSQTSQIMPTMSITTTGIVTSL